MKLKKILNGDNVQGFKIEQPTKNFKKLFPKTYIFSLDLFGKQVVYNLDTIPVQFTITPPIGYIFTYSNTLPKWLICNHVKYKDVGGCFPSCLDAYFTGENVNLVLSCCPKNKVVPARFVNEIVIKCNSKDLMQDVKQVESNLSNETASEDTLTGGNKKSKKQSEGNNVQKNIMNILINYLKDGETTPEQWARDVIFNFPININGLPVCYPKTIDKKALSQTNLKPLDVFIQYDFRADNYEDENNFIITLEDGFEDLNSTITFYNTYNNILPKVKSQLKSKKRPFKEISSDAIEVKAKFLRNLDISYQIIDFI